MASLMYHLAYRLLRQAQPTRFPDPPPPACTAAVGSPFPPPPAAAAPQAPPVAFPMLNYSHRGGGQEHDPHSRLQFVENTMPAFRNSARLGVDLLELDVQVRD